MIISRTMSQQELSQKKIEAYTELCKIINWGRCHPVKFAEIFFGLSLIDFQKLVMTRSWTVPYALWLECRGAGKDTLAAVYFMTKLTLIPNYIVYVSTNSAAQSIESFEKLKNIALQRIPSFRDATDVFAREIDKSETTTTSGFTSNKDGSTFRLYNNSQMVTLSSNIEANRGKRGALWFNETAWKNAEDIAVMENFANVDTNFFTTVKKQNHIDPIQMPLQLLYTSSAGDATFPFYEKYKKFAMKMFAGDRNYYCVDIDAYDVLDHSTMNGEKIKSHLTAENIKKAIEEDPEAAEQELFNRFRKGGGVNAVVSMDVLIRNSVVRKPILSNETGNKKFIFCYDPARNYDNSILSIWEIYREKRGSWKLKIANVVSMVDHNTEKKTPLTMVEQLKIIKNLMIRYNGVQAAEWENIEFYIDAGSGGGGVGSIADQLMSDWYDEQGQKHRGIIDPEHPQYATARQKYTNAAPIVHLIDPQKYKKIIYDALAKMTALNLMEFTMYDKRDYIMLDSGNGEMVQSVLSDEEKLALLQINMMKTEISYMCRFDTPNGGVSYELSRDKKNKMHDDRAYTAALAAYALAVAKRTDLLRIDEEDEYKNAPKCVSAISYEKAW